MSHPMAITQRHLTIKSNTPRQVRPGSELYINATFGSAQSYQNPDTINLDTETAQNSPVCSYGPRSEPRSHHYFPYRSTDPKIAVDTIRASHLLDSKGHVQLLHKIREQESTFGATQIYYNSPSPHLQYHDSWTRHHTDPSTLELLWQEHEKSLVSQKLTDLYSTLPGIVPPFLDERLKKIGIFDSNEWKSWFSGDLGPSDILDLSRNMMVDLGLVIARLCSLLETFGDKQESAGKGSTERGALA